MNILLLGGFWQSERSMYYGLKDIGIDLKIVLPIFVHPHLNTVAPYDDNKYGIVRTDDLDKYLNTNKVDIIIHRHYMLDPVFHKDSLFLAGKYNIPFYHFDAEGYYGYYGDDWTPPQCDAFLCRSYVPEHIIKKLNAVGIRHYYLPPGVSSIERKIDKPRTKNFGSIGMGRNFKSRHDQIYKYGKWVQDNFNELMYVYGDGSYWSKLAKENNYEQYIKYGGIYFPEDTEDTINDHKIMMNYETCPDLDSSFSVKIWQTMGCGIPTISPRKPHYEKLFGDDTLLFDDDPLLVDKVRVLLTDDAAWNEFSNKIYDYMHKHFNYGKMLPEILMKENMI